MASLIEASAGHAGLRGAWVVVTGASRNIGRAVALAFAREGANLVLCARGVDDLTAVADEVRAERAGAEVVTLVSDVGVASQRERLVDAAHEAASGPIDVLVNNAYAHGATRGTDIFDIADDVWDTTVEVNLRAPYDLVRRFGRRMCEASGGSVVNVVAGPGLQPAAGWAPYGATTAALWNLTRYLSLECAPALRVNAVCPGTIHGEHEYREFAREVLLPTVPLARIGRPDEVAEAVVFLASPRASYITGALLTVNGGRPW